jgi:hypothetical protein
VKGASVSLWRIRPDKAKVDPAERLGAERQWLETKPSFHLLGAVCEQAATKSSTLME